MAAKTSAGKKIRSYPASDSPLFHIRSKRRLATVLGWSGAPSSICAFARRKDNFNRYFKRSNAAKPRLVEAPQAGLKILQKRIEVLLKRIEIPGYLHSGTPGRSYLSNSNAHRDVAGCTVTLDISQFFQSVSQDRIERLFIKKFDCARDVAEVLAMLVCCDGHLATGSPASPLLSYFANAEVFDAIAGRAVRSGAEFTLYMDDVAVTGTGVGHGDIRWIERLLARVGLRVQKTKTRVFRASRARLITGRVLHKGQSRAPNNQHLKMKDAVDASKACPSDLHMRASAVGRIRHVALLDDERQAELRRIARDMK